MEIHENESAFGHSEALQQKAGTRRLCVANSILIHRSLLRVRRPSERRLKPNRTQSSQNLRKNYRLPSSVRPPARSHFTAVCPCFHDGSITPFASKFECLRVIKASFRHACARCSAASPHFLTPAPPKHALIHPRHSVFGHFQAPPPPPRGRPFGRHPAKSKSIKPKP